MLLLTRSWPLVWLVSVCGCGRTTLVLDDPDGAPDELVDVGSIDDTSDTPDETSSDAWSDGDASTEVASADATSDVATDVGDVGPVDAVPTGPEVLTTKLVAPRGIAIGGGFAWVTDMAGQIVRVPLAGGGAVKIAPASRPTYIAVDSAYVYWTDLGVGTPNSGSVGRYEIATGAVTSLAKGQEAPNSTVLRGADVLFAQGRDAGEIRAVPRAGGPVVPVASAEPEPYYVAANSTRICWVRRTAASSIVCREDGAVAPTTLVPAHDFIRHLAIDESNAFWLSEQGHLLGISLSGGPLKFLWPEPPTTKTPAGADIALDATHVYWLVGAYVRKIAKAGGPTTQLAVDKYPLGIAVDDTHVYWTSETTVKRVPK